MITSALILLIASLLLGLSNLLPAGDTLPAGVENAFTWLVSASAPFDYILPITTIWIIVTVMLPILVAYFFWNGVQWIINMIRGN